MSAPIHSHRPGLKILITKRKKSTLVGGRGGSSNSTQSFDLTHALGDKGSCIVTKNLYAYHGEFHIILPDMPFDFGGTGGVQETVDSPYGLIEPMDVVEIRMDRDVKPDMPIVMRGLVRSVGRDETVGEDGRPMRRVSIVGHDFGCIFTISQLWLRVGLREGNIIDPVYGPLGKVGLISEPVEVEEFIQKLLDYGNESVESTGISVKPKFEDVKGWVVPTALPSIEGPLWITMIRFSDSPWNELFVQDPPTGDSPELVFRQTPWKDTDGEFIWFKGSDEPEEEEEELVIGGVRQIKARNSVAVKVFDVEMADVLSISSHRNDSGVANFIWVDMPPSFISAHWQQLLSPHAQKIAKEAEKDPNSTKNIYGDRLLTQNSFIGPNLAPKDQAEKDQEKSEDDWSKWRKDRIDWLHKASEDNADFEQGAITVKGDPKYQVGNYLNLKRGVPWEGYIVGITHEYRAYREYLTTIEFIRGTGFIERVESNNPWNLERKIKNPWTVIWGEGVKTS
ncbi:MAG: hypothetical protein ABFS02_02630 [Pseudomonadota bacterium]